MSWIKRNLFFFIGSVVALALMGLAGWFLYSKWQLNNSVQTELAGAYDKLKGLKTQNPHPGDAKVNNIEIARAQQKEVTNFVQTARSHFASVPRIPSAEDEPKVTDQGFTRALSRAIDQLQKQATNASVNLPPNYSFSFEAEKSKLSFSPAGLLPLATQLGEIKAICDVLFDAKINSLDNLRRERVAPEDSGTGALLTDYHTEKTATNELAVITPYEVTFKCFSTELGQVLGGFAGSPHAFIIKTINVEGAPIVQPQPDQNPVVPVQPVYIQPQPMAQPNAANDAAAQAARFASRYGINRYGAGGAGPAGGVPYRSAPVQPVYVPQPTTASASSRSSVLPTVLDERQLKVTINLALVKLLTPK